MRDLDRELEAWQRERERKKGRRAESPTDVLGDIAEEFLDFLEMGAGICAPHSTTPCTCVSAAAAVDARLRGTDALICQRFDPPITSGQMFLRDRAWPPNTSVGPCCWWCTTVTKPRGRVTCATQCDVLVWPVQRSAARALAIRRGACCACVMCVVDSPVAMQRQLRASAAAGLDQTSRDIAPALAAALRRTQCSFAKGLREVYACI